MADQKFIMKTKWLRYTQGDNAHLVYVSPDRKHDLYGPCRQDCDCPEGAEPGWLLNGKALVDDPEVIAFLDLLEAQEA